MELTLCHRCRSDYEDAGKDLVPKFKKQAHETCDKCQFRRGITYIILEPYKRKPPKYIQKYYPELIK